MTTPHFTMKKPFLLFAAFALLAGSAVAQSSTWTIDPAHSEAHFEVRHMSVSNVRGSIGGVSGTVVWDPANPANDSVNATLDVTTIDSGNSYRDKDLKTDAFFNTDKFKTIVFKSTSVTPSGSGLKIAGTLTIAGVTRPVVLDSTAPAAPQKGLQGGLVTGIEATITIKRADFNIGGKYPSMVISDDVKITIDAEMDKK
ncbi:MAG TPA: YceI family protein [Candidatus Angelobacter sp.]|nr:YceI family protein [Candidatus Angelobacter sp.]